VGREFALALAARRVRSRKIKAVGPGIILVLSVELHDILP